MVVVSAVINHHSPEVVYMLYCVFCSPSSVMADDLCDEERHVLRIVVSIGGKHD